MFRSLLWFGFLVFYVLLLLPAMAVYFLIYVFSGEKKARNFCFTVSRFACFRALRVAGIKLKITGIENLPETNFFIPAPNHQGSFDAVVMLIALNRPFGFAAKKTLSFIPIVGVWFKLFGAVFVDRKNIEKAESTVDKCVKVLKTDRPLLIFPEGTRSKTGKINDIKAGVFRISVKSGAPIIPVVINGTRSAWEKKKRISPCEITVKIMPELKMASDTKRAALNVKKQELRQIYEDNL